MARGIKRIEATAATRAKILEVARGLFQRQGFDKTNLRQVALLAGNSTGAIFSSFKSKEALFEASMGRPAPDVPTFLRDLESCWPIGYSDPHRALHAFVVRAGDLLRDIEGTPE